MSSSLGILIDTRKRYKAGTKTLLDWLFDAVEETERGGQHRGARTSARTLQPRAKRYSVDELPILARIVAEAEPRVTIPLEMLDVAKDVINLRKRCCDFWSSRRCHPDKTEADRIAMLNGTHRHFLEKFEEVFAVLKQEAKKRQPKRKKVIKLAADANDLSNLFLHLELEESEEYSSMPDDTHTSRKCVEKTRTHQPTPSMGYELEGDGEFTVMLATWSLLRDLHDLRIPVVAMWKDQALGKISYLAACQTTEHAIQVCMAIATTFHDQHESVSSYLDILKLAGEYTKLPDALSAQSKTLDDSKYMSCPEMLCTAAWAVLRDVSQQAEVSPGHHSNVVAQVDEDVAVSCIHPFAEGLLSMLPDLLEMLELSKGKTGSPSSNLWSFADEYTQQLGKFVARPHWNTGFVAATQLLLDILEYLSKDMNRCVSQCETTLDNVSTMATDYMEWNGQLDDITKENTSPRGPDWLEERQCIVVPHCTDKRGKDGWMVKLNLTPDGFQDEHCFIPRNVLKILPMLACHLTWKVRIIAHRTAIALCNSRHAILAAAHLHNATKLLHIPVHDWNELESVVLEQGSYLRQGDGSVRSAARHYGMALGLSLAEVSCRSRPEIPSCNTTAHKANSLQAASSFEAQDGGNLLMHDGLLQMSTFYDAIRCYANEYGVKDEAIAKQWKTTKMLTPGQVPVVLREMVLKDEERISIDYIGLLRSCVEVLREVTTAFSSQQQSKPLILRSPNRQYFYQQVYDIFWEAAGIETRELPVRRSPLFSASECIKAALNEDTVDMSEGSTDGREPRSSSKL